MPNYKYALTEHVIKAFARSKKRKRSDGITLMIIPHSQKHVMRVRINYNLIYFIVLIIGLTGLFSLLSLSYTQEANIIKDREAQNYRIWDYKIQALHDGINKIYSNLHLFKKYGVSFYSSIWNEDINDVLTPSNSISDHVEKSSKELRATLNFLLEREKALRNLPSGWPLDIGYITSVYGSRISPFGYSEDFHWGYDFANAVGTPIKATADGKVIFAGGGHSGYGNYVMILHEHGFVTVYAHADRVLVEKDDKIKRGDVIALLGSTGSATGPHVHYEVRLQNPDPENQFDIILNPLPFIKGQY